METAYIRERRLTQKTTVYQLERLEQGSPVIVATFSSFESASRFWHALRENHIETMPDWEKAPFPLKRSFCFSATEERPNLPYR